MLPFNMNHFYYFYVIAKKQSFTEASRELMVSQSSLSIQLKQFERALGTTLFNRKKTGVELTDVGEIAFQVADRIFPEVGMLRSSIQEAEHSVSGRVSIATVNSIGIYVLPAILKSFKERYPDVKVSIDFKHSREVIEMVQAGKADAAIITWSRKYPDLTALELKKNKMFLVAAPEHPLAGRENISPRELEEHQFIAYEEGSPTRTMMDGLFKRLALDIEYTIESSNVATIKRMAMAGLGLAILPEVAIGLEIRQGLLTRLSVPSLSMAQELTLYTKTNRTLSATARAFVEFVYETLNPKQTADEKRKKGARERRP
ncbi:MAG: LysR family transcriptional regulator [Chitinivibrionia bacterium]|nr:LysR family transcriptional regulator [Chitinivibrionia bacterium]